MNLFMNFVTTQLFTLLLKELEEHEPELQQALLALIDKAVEHFGDLIKQKLNNQLGA